MVTISINDDNIIAYGHAETKPVCGLFSGVVVFVQLGLETLGEGEAMCLSSGSMSIDRSKVVSMEGIHLISTLISSLYNLSEEYPDSFRIYT